MEKRTRTIVIWSIILISLLSYTLYFVATRPLEITDLRVTDITDNSATILWNTNHPSYWGISENVTSLDGKIHTISVDCNSLNTSFSYPEQLLKKCSAYTVTVHAALKYEDVSVSGKNVSKSITFSTTGTLPVISSLSIDHGIITFYTNIPCTAKVIQTDGNVLHQPDPVGYYHYMDMGINGLLGGYNAILRVTDNDGGATEEYVRFYCSPRIYIPVIGMADQISVINNPEAKDISYADLVTFLKKDDTDKAIYDSSKFVCADFAEQLQHRAEVTGIRCAFVEIEFVVGLHACNAFQTTDKGLVFIDDTGSSKSYHPHNMDTEVIVDKGKSYCPVALFYEGGWDSQYDCMGTVADYKIYWKGLYPIPVDSEDLVRIK